MIKKLKAIWLRLYRKHICEHKGCLNEAMQCRIYDYGNNQDICCYWYCTEHTHMEGFCWYCGEFWGGCEAFDFNKSGLCPNCKDEVDSELESDFDDEYEDWLYDIQEENAYQAGDK